jgi:hypothetical protein
MQFEESCQAQIDNHWHMLEYLKAEFTVAQTDQTTPTQRLTALVDGIQAKYEQNTTTARNNILDIQARMLPELCMKTNAMDTALKGIHTRVETLGDTVTLLRTEVATNANLAAALPLTENERDNGCVDKSHTTTTTSVNTTPATSTPHPSTRSDTSWCHGQKPCYDDATTRPALVTVDHNNKDVPHLRG